MKSHGFLYSQTRYWYKKGEYRISRPHGQSDTAFRSGDGWSWLTVCHIFSNYISLKDHQNYLDQVKEKMYGLLNPSLSKSMLRKVIRRKTAYTRGCDVAISQKETKLLHFKAKASTQN